MGVVPGRRTRAERARGADWGRGAVRLGVPELSEDGVANARRAASVLSADAQGPPFSEQLSGRSSQYKLLYQSDFQMLQIPTGLCGPWRQRRGDEFPALRHVRGLLPTV